MVESGINYLGDEGGQCSVETTAQASVAQLVDVLVEPVLFIVDLLPPK